jgi:hypothetical protein
MSTTHVGQAPEVEEPDFDKDVKVFKSRPLVVSWSTVSATTSAARLRPLRNLRLDGRGPKALESLPS